MKDRGITPTPHDDPQVDAAWTSTSRDEPPVHLDAAILAAARDAVDTNARRRPDTPHASWWRRWQPLAAAAGVAGLALVLAQRLPTDAPVAETARPPAPEPARVESYERPGAVASEGPAARTPEREQPSAPPTAPTPAPAPPHAESAAAPLDRSAGASGNDAAAKTADSAPLTATQQPSTAATDEYGIASSAAELAVAPAARPAADAAAVGGAPRPTPEQWASRIGELHASGEAAVAAEELIAFRRLHADADAYLPPELRGWAATVEAQPSD